MMTNDPRQLLHQAADAHPQARVHVETRVNFFEVDLRHHHIYQLNRTMTDGAFYRGLHVLPALLGARPEDITHVKIAADPQALSARQRKSPASASASASAAQTLPCPLQPALDQATHQLHALRQAITDAALPHIQHITFDTEVLASLQSTFDTTTHTLIRRLRQQKTPQLLLAHLPQTSRHTLTQTLADLVRQAAITHITHGTSARSAQPTQHPTPQTPQAPRYQPPSSMVHKTHPHK